MDAGSSIYCKTEQNQGTAIQALNLATLSQYSWGENWLKILRKISYSLHINDDRNLCHKLFRAFDVCFLTYLLNCHFPNINKTTDS